MNVQKGRVKKSPAKAIVCGGVAGAIEAAVTYPTEFLKTYMQLYKDWSKKGINPTVKHIYNKWGISGFYRGLSVLVFFSIPKTGTRFGAYELARNNVFKEEHFKNDSIRNFFCGTFAGALEAIIAVTAMETIKTKMIHDKVAGTNKYNGLFHGMSKIAQLEGFSGLYKGLGPTIAKTSSSHAIRFWVYSDTNKFLKGYIDNYSACAMIAGAWAGLVSVYANAPIDVIKTNMQGESAK